MTKFRFRWPEDYSKDLRTLPKPVLARLTLAAFLMVGSVFMSTDLMNGIRFPLWWSVAQASVIGLAAAATLGTRRNRRWVVVLFLIVMAGTLIGIGAVPSKLPVNRALFAPELEPIRRRLALDAALMMGSAAMGYAIFLRTVGGEVARHVRTRAELVLAEMVQQSLAPPLAMRAAGYEVHGRSAPCSQMGGDLLDAVEERDGLALYVADVAGHGIQAGVFMGMVKSSVRTALMRPGSLAELLGDLNQVICQVKTSPATYVTFACLRCREGGHVEYSLAGSGPILHYRARTKSCEQAAMEQFPLGLFAKAEFESGGLQMEPGDILALMTDGIPETVNAQDDQFGLDRIGGILVREANAPTEKLAESIFAAVRRHGAQTDDETLVLIRASA